MKYLGWINKNIPNLDGKTIIVTGANSGIGFKTSLTLAYKGATIILACRNLKKGQNAIDMIKKEVPNANLFLEEYDQASFESIDAFCSRIQKNYPRIDSLVCNAGVYFPKANYKTKDGLELTIGTNYIGVFKLIEGLKKYLDKASARVVLVNSLVSINAKDISLKDAMNLKRNALYSYSKCSIARYGYELIKGNNSNITYRIVHPGICSTNIISSEQTGFPTWFGVLGHKILTAFTHSSSKACLTAVLGVVDDQKLEYITPRGPFAISGFPKRKKLQKFMDRPIIEETKDLIKEI